MPITKPTKMQASLIAACAHVEALRGNENAIMCYRVLPETPKAKEAFKEMSPKPRMNYRGPISSHFETLKQRNNGGYGVYYTLNKTDGNGTAKKNITAVLALPLDLDGAPLPKKFLGELTPHIILESSPGKFQCVWKIVPTDDLAAAKHMVQRLAKAYGGDPSVCDAPRILRLAGFKHQKGKPFISRIIETDEFQPPYKLAQFDKVLPKMPRVKASSAASGVGTIDADKAKLLLGAMKPEDAVPTNDDWEKLAMSLHVGGKGDDDVRDVFLEWCQTDEKYSSEANYDNNLYRWNTFDADKEGGRGVGTLRTICKDQGVPASIMDQVFKSDIGDDFADLKPGNEPMNFDSNDDEIDFDTPDDQPQSKLSKEFAEFDDADTITEEDDVNDTVGGWPKESNNKLEKLNEKYCGVFSHGKYRIMSLEDSDVGFNWSASSRQDFEAAFLNQKIMRDMTGLSKNASEMTTLGEGWQRWGARKTAHGTTFNTKALPGEIINERLNLWAGFSITPEFGECEKFKGMIRDDLCAGDLRVYEFVIKWIAWKLQNPGLLPQTAIVWVGHIGAGKTTLGEVLVGYFGIHGLSIDSIESITGKFNGHLESVCFIYADEATWGGDKKRVGPLKKLITDRDKDFEYKGLTKFRGLNRVGLMLGSNEDWVVPAGKDERRYVVQRVSNAHYVNMDALKPDSTADKEEKAKALANRKYWDDIHAELKTGGRAAFLWDMLHMKLEKGWHPREGIPATQAMAEQKFQGLQGVDKWWFERLRDAELPGGEDAIINAKSQKLSESDWPEGEMYLTPKKVAADFRSWLAFRNPHMNVTDQTVLDGLKIYGWQGGRGMKHPTGARMWVVPKLRDARKAMATKLGHHGLFST